MNRIFNTITIYVVVIVAIAMTGTFLSDHLNEIKWFGDSTFAEEKCLAVKAHKHYIHGVGKLNYVKNGECDYFKIVLAAPQQYMGEKDKKSGEHVLWIWISCSMIIRLYRQRL